jgi:hypothetical protein
LGGSAHLPRWRVSCHSDPSLRDPGPDAHADGHIHRDEYSFLFKFPPGSAIASQSDNTARIFLPFTTGTLLVEKYIDLTVVEGASPCKYGASGGATATSGNVTINGITFLKETGSEGAAGNLYEWESYSVVRPNTNACVSVGFILHSTNPGNYTTPPPPFDKVAESAVFATIMSTFAWSP